MHTPARKQALSVPEDLARVFRSYAARANYRAMNRADLAQAARELCRRMREPTWADVSALRRLAAYLAGSPRQVHCPFYTSPSPRHYGESRLPSSA